MSLRARAESIRTLSVIVPKNPFAPPSLQKPKHCLCALSVEQLMEWWPGTPHSPHRDSNKVKAIQRSLDWKRVCQIAAYLLQQEITDAPMKLDQYFRDIYQPKKNETGREWPPRVGKVIGFPRSEFPMFSNVLLHVNGARIKELKIAHEHGAATLIFNENSPELNFSVIDGQHRINGAYLAVKLLQKKTPDAVWELPAEIFLELDPPREPPRRQAQIFIDVNFYQKKVDRSLVADLFPTARGEREPIDKKERAQDIGRKLMLETGPLVGMIQIPGIKYGVKDVVTLATLNGAIEDVLDILHSNDIQSLGSQTEFLAQCFTAWFEASGRFEDPAKARQKSLSPQNVAYQGRVLVSILTLVPAVILKLKRERVPFVSEKASKLMASWLKDRARKANLLEDDVFIGKDKFKERGYLGSGGIGRFRDSLWAVVIGKHQLTSKVSPPKVALLAEKNRATVSRGLQNK